MKKRYLGIAIMILSIISLFLGAKNVGFLEVISGNKEGLEIMIISRIPRLISILVSGIGMSICGLIMQQISQNKFVSPTTGATIDSAKLGIIVAMIVVPGASIFTKSMISFVFALSGTFFFMKFIKNIKFKNIVFVPLIGIMFGNIIGSFTTFLGYKFDMMQSVNAWMQGNFSMILKGNYELLYITIPLIIVAILYANKFTIVGMGEDFSKNLGLNYNRFLNIGLIIIALVTVAVVITAGNIPYIGLIVPNIVSMYKGDNLKDSIFDTALFGAVFVLGCDIVSRIVIYPYELSVGLTVGVIGSAIFLYMIIRRKNYAN